MSTLPDHIKILIEHATSWDEWEKIEQEVFDVNNWKKRSLEQLDQDLNRPNVEKNGILWEQKSDPYDISPDLRDQYQLARKSIFAKLEPEGHANNLEHPEHYGKSCSKCKMWARSNEIVCCPFCGRELYTIPLNNWD